MSFFIFLQFAIEILFVPFSEHLIFIMLLLFGQGLYFPYFSHLFFNIFWICHQLFPFFLELNQMLGLFDKLKAFLDCGFSPFIYYFLKIFQLIFPFLQLLNSFSKLCFVNLFHNVLDNFFHF